VFFFEFSGDILGCGGNELRKAASVSVAMPTIPPVIIQAKDLSFRRDSHAKKPDSSAFCL
jgi:hypothetical protein